MVTLFANWFPTQGPGEGHAGPGLLTTVLVVVCAGTAGPPPLWVQVAVDKSGVIVCKLE